MDKKLTQVQNDDCSKGEVFGEAENNPEVLRYSPILNTPSFSNKFGRTARRNTRSRIVSLGARSVISNPVQPLDNHNPASDSPEVSSSFKEVVTSATTPIDKTIFQVEDRHCLDSDEDLFASTACTAEEMVPSGLGTLLGGPQPSDISWTSSMATPLPENVSYSNLNTEERRILLPSDECGKKVKPRALFSPDPNETVGCQSLNVSSDLDCCPTAKTGKNQLRNASGVSRILPKTCSDTSSLSKKCHCKYRVCEDHESEPVNEYLDSLDSSVQKPRLKCKCTSGAEIEKELSKERVESPVLSGSSHLTEVSSVKKLFGSELDDPFLDYEVEMNCSDQDIHNRSRKKIIGESTPSSSLKRIGPSDSRSITSTPNGILHTSETFLGNTSVAAIDNPSKVEVEKEFSSSLMFEDLQDANAPFKRKRLIFNLDLEEESKQNPLNVIPNVPASEPLNDFVIPDDSLMEHLATMNASSAVSPKAKVMAIKNSYNTRLFHYSANQAGLQEPLPVRKLKSPLKEILCSANALEAVPNLVKSGNSLKPTEELIAFNKFYKPMQMQTVHPESSCSQQYVMAVDVISELNHSFSDAPKDAESISDLECATLLKEKFLNSTASAVRTSEQSKLITPNTFESSLNTDSENSYKGTSSLSKENNVDSVACSSTSVNLVKPSHKEALELLSQSHYKKTHHPLPVIKTHQADNCKEETKSPQQPVSKHSIAQLTDSSRKANMHSLNLMISSSHEADMLTELCGGFKTAGGSEICVPEHVLEKALSVFEGCTDLFIPVKSRMSDTEGVMVEENSLCKTKQSNPIREFQTERQSNSFPLNVSSSSVGKEAIQPNLPPKAMEVMRTSLASKRKIMEIKEYPQGMGGDKRQKITNQENPSSTSCEEDLDFDHNQALLDGSNTTGEIRARMLNQELLKAKNSLQFGEIFTGSTSNTCSADKTVPDNEYKCSMSLNTNKVSSNFDNNVHENQMDERLRNEAFLPDCPRNAEVVMEGVLHCASSGMERELSTTLKKTVPVLECAASETKCLLSVISSEEAIKMTSHCKKGFNIPPTVKSVFKHPSSIELSNTIESVSNKRSNFLKNNASSGLQKSSCVQESLSSVHSKAPNKCKQDMNSEACLDVHSVAIECMKDNSITSGNYATMPNAKLETTQKISEGLYKQYISSVGEMTGFSTASGKSVSVSSAAIESARGIFESLDEEKPFSVIDMKGFSTATGKSVSVSSAAVGKARRIFKGVDGYEPNGVSEMKEFFLTSDGFPDMCGKQLSMSNTGIEKSQIHESMDVHNPSNISDTKMDMKGFTTASGKVVSVSQAAIKKAQSIFNGLDEQESPEFADMKGFSTASGKSVSVSNAALQNAQKIFKGLNEDDNNAAGNVKGFATASGKSVSVTKAALQKAREIFKDLDEHDISNTGSVERFSAGPESLHRTTSQKTVSQIASTFNENNTAVDEQGFSLAAQGEVDDICQIKDRASLALLKKQKFSVKNSPLVPDLKPETNISKTFEPREILGSLDKGKVKFVSKPIPKDCSRSNFHCSGGTDNVSSLFVDDEFFNDSESMNAITNVMASICTSPSMISDRTPSLQPVLSAEAQDPGKSSEPTSPILVKNGPRRRLRRGRLSLANLSSRSSSPVVNMPSENETQNSSSLSVPGVNHAISDSVNNKMIMRNTDSLSIEVRHEATNIENNTASFPSYSRNRQSSVRVVQNKAADCEIPSVVETTSCNSVDDDSVVCPIEANSFSNSITSAKTTSIETFSKTGKFTSKRKSASCMPDSDTFEAKRRRSTSNIYSFAAWPSRVLEDERILRPEVAEMRKRAGEEQKELVDRCEDKGERLQPCVGSLLSYKLSMKKKQLSLVEMVGGTRPACLSTEKLKGYGVNSNVFSITGHNAATFRFSAWDFYSADVCRENVSGIPVGDGALLVFDSYGEAGITEIERAFLASPGVDPTLVPSGWVKNHFRWIVWKLASMERSFPLQFGNRCLTPHVVMQQLKYRYDREVDRCERSALRRIFEHDDSAAKRMVLCVAGVLKKNNAEERQEVELELTDGWYSILASIDSELQHFVSQNVLKVGTKLITHNAELLNSSEGCSPLEVQSDVRLRLFTNSTRRARWFTKLGFQTNPGPIKVPLYSVLGLGGIVSCFTAHVARVYPLLYFEKKGDKTVVRSERSESREAITCDRRRQDLVEQVYNQVRTEVHKEHDGERQHNKPTHRSVASLTSGEELFELLESAPDPASVQCMMTEEQTMLVANYQRVREESIRQKVETRVFQKLNENSKSERQVTPFLKVRLIDSQKDGHFVTAILSIWRPTEEISQIFKEGHKVSVIGSFSSGFRCGVLQLTSKRSTRYEQHGFSGLITSKLRIVSPLKELMTPNFSPIFGELDVVGVVIRMGPPPKSAENSTFYQTVYIADSYHNLVGISFLGGIKEFAFEDVVVRNSFIAASNLQWHPNPVVRLLPSVYANEMSSFTSKPRLPHLQLALQELRQSVPLDMESFLKVGNEKLDLLLSSKIMTAGVSSRATNVHGTFLEKTPGKLKPEFTAGADGTIRTPSDSSPSKSSRKFTSDHQTVTPSREFSPVVEKRLAKLEMYGDAPPLSPIVFGQPNRLLRRSFQAPRRISDTHVESSPISSGTHP